MIMQRVIRVNGFDVEQGVCVVQFRLESELGEKEATHGEVYKLLDTADQVSTNDTLGLVAIAKHGNIQVKIFIRNSHK